VAALEFSVRWWTSKDATFNVFHRFLEDETFLISKVDKKLYFLV